jgi:hypothetical protein
VGAAALSLAGRTAWDDPVEQPLSRTAAAATATKPAPRIALFMATHHLSSERSVGWSVSMQQSRNGLKDPQYR